MDTNNKQMMSYEVSNINEEVSYDKQIGCTAQINTSGNSAAISCPLDEFTIYQAPRARRTARRLAWLASAIFDIPSLALIVVSLAIVPLVVAPIAFIWWVLETWDARRFARKPGTA